MKKALMMNTAIVWLEASLVGIVCTFSVLALELVRKPACFENESASRQTDADDVIETVFRYMMGSGIMSGHQYCLGIKCYGFEADPGIAMMDRFASNLDQVHRRSECSIDSLGISTGGALLSITGIEWETPDRVEVRAYSYMHPFSVAGYVFVLHKTQDEWRVVDSFMSWIS